nr:hypothetical protein [Actinoplanes polyasparticus]
MRIRSGSAVSWTRRIGQPDPHQRLDANGMPAYLEATSKQNRRL